VDLFESLFPRHQFPNWTTGARPAWPRAFVFLRHEICAANL